MPFVQRSAATANLELYKQFKNVLLPELYVPTIDLTVTCSSPTIELSDLRIAEIQEIGMNEFSPSINSTVNPICRSYATF